MRRGIFIAGFLFGAMVLIATALVGYAYFNLAAIVDRNQKRVLARISDAIGRPIEVQRIEARPGWVVSLTVRGLKVDDDPAFSQLPFIIANEVVIRLEFWPLLRGKAKVTEIELTKPQIRVLRGANDILNVEALGRAAAAKRPGVAPAMAKSLTISDGTILYRDLGRRGVGLEIHHLDFQVANFSLYKPFDVALKLAVLAEVQNVELSGRIGPLIRERMLEPSRVPLGLRLRLTGVTVDRLHKLAEFGAEMPFLPAVSGPLTLSGTISGEFRQPSLTAFADLTPNRVQCGTVFDKAAGTAMALAIGGSSTAAGVQIVSATVKLADLALTARDAVFEKNRFSAQVDTNRFDLAALAHASPVVAAYGLFGKAEIHGLVRLVDGKPDMDGIVTLTRAGAARRGARIPAVSELTGKIEFAHNSAAIAHTDFLLGGARATLQARADSLSPLKASYTFTADSVRAADLMVGRPSREVFNRLNITGAAYGSFTAPSLNMKIGSSDGMLAGLDYRDLSVSAVYADRRLSARPLNVAMFGGSISANGDIAFNARPQFNVSAGIKRLNAEQLLRWAKPNASPMLRGRLTGNVQIAGRGAKWKQIEPTLNGNGRLAIADGKLTGVNIVALAINSLTGLPGISQLLSAAAIPSHRGIMADPDTELTHASLSFDLQGTRITTHDLTAQSEFYGIRGDGWFDMDNNVDMSIDIQLHFGLSAALPVFVEGRWPAVVVLPDVPKLAERLATGALSIPGQILEKGAGVLQRVLP